MFGSGPASASRLWDFGPVQVGAAAGQSASLGASESHVKLSTIDAPRYHLDVFDVCGSARKLLLPQGAVELPLSIDKF